jgi:N-acetylglucosaminyldiphosphoundecaprenol N-acetyl-beta-D-mannosaminyltransferase
MARDLEILGVGVDIITGEEMLQRIEMAVREKQKRLFVYINAHAVNLAQGLPWFRLFLNSADIAYADGQGIRWAAWILGKTMRTTVPLTRWITDLCRFCESKELSIFLLGGTDAVAAGAATELKGRFPKLAIAGRHDGFFNKSGPENDTVIETINRASPNLLFVGFGMPLQEEWINTNMHRLHANVILPSGSCFDYVAGVRRRAPLWVSRTGFEWLFRFFQEPVRLFSRYIIGNPKFLISVLWQRLRN